MATSKSFRSQSPAQARQVVRAALQDVSPEVIGIAELLTSELITNAIIHARSEPIMAIQVEETNRYVRVEVEDSSPFLNLRPLHVKPSDPHGRGLAIVFSLASRWGVEPREHGKAVWFELDL